MTTLLGKLRSAVARDRDLPLRAVVAKALRFLVTSATAPWYLRRCDAVGARPRTIGQPIINNEGTIVIGREFYCSSERLPVDLTTAPGGVIDIGDEVILNYGTSIHARGRVHLGNKTTVGPQTVLWDSEDDDGTASDIDIGESVWLAARVTVRPGSRIGNASIISAGSVVAGDIPAGVIAAGNPARVLRHNTYLR